MPHRAASEKALREAFPRAGDVPEAIRWTADETGLRLLAGGKLSHWEGAHATIRSAVCVREGRTLDPLPLGPGALATREFALEAVEAAGRAWAGGRGEWPRASAADRIAAVRDFARRAAPLRERVARALMWEVGKPWADCLVEFDRTFKYVEETLATLERAERDQAAPLRAGGFAARVRRAPLGIALCLGPYNYALNETFTTVVPALVMGNPVIVKTPRYGVLANALLAPALAESFPPGVANLVTGHGPDVVGPMMETGRVDVLAFIGSARTAGTLLRQHPRPWRLRPVLGMGAKNPAIVLADSDLEQAAGEIVSGALTFNGQRCTAIKHVLVARRVAGTLVDRLAACIDALKIGMPWQEGVTVTPMPDPKHPAYLQGLVEDAVAKGARLVNRGGATSAGTLFRPALVDGVTPAMRLYHEEQFGPVVPVSAFDAPDEALEAVDRAEVGQQASIFGKDRAVIGRMVDHLANLVCRINLDTQCRRGPDVFPFAGRKDSAVGTLSVYDALRTFSIRSLVAVADGERALLDDLQATSRFLAPPPA